MNITERPLYDKTREKPFRSEEHLAWVRSFPCLVPGCRRKPEAAHIGPHGHGQKASDLETVPLCDKHHRTDPYSLHAIGRARFEALHNIHLLDFARRLRRKPRLYVADGRYVARIDGEDFVLRPVQDGLRKAVETALTICRETRVLHRESAA